MKKENFSKSNIICPICRDEKVKRGRVYGHYDIFDCKTCGGSFSQPMVSVAYENNELEKMEFGDALKKSLRRNFVYCVASAFLQKINKKSILDIGAGQGIMLHHAKNLGYKTYGTEVSEKTIKVLEENCPFVETVQDKNLENLPLDWPKKYDVISCLDVLEHVENPVLLLRGIKDKLNDNGFLIISLPNRDRYYYKLGGLVDDFVPKEHGGDNPPYHLTFWKKRTVEKFMEQAGFDNYSITIGGLLWRKNVFVKGERSFILSGLLKIFYSGCHFLPLFAINIIEKWGTHLIVIARREKDEGELKKIFKDALGKTYKKRAPFFVDGEID